MCAIESPATTLFMFDSAPRRTPAGLGARELEPWGLGTFPQSSADFACHPWRCAGTEKSSDASREREKKKGTQNNKHSLKSKHAIWSLDDECIASLLQRPEHKEKLNTVTFEALNGRTNTAGQKVGFGLEIEKKRKNKTCVFFWVISTNIFGRFNCIDCLRKKDTMKMAPEQVLWKEQVHLTNIRRNFQAG